MQEEKKRISDEMAESPQIEKSKDSLQIKRSRAKPSSEQFVEGLITRGEAAKPVRRKLPPGATHEIVKQKGKKGTPEVRRRRFSLS